MLAQNCYISDPKDAILIQFLSEAEVKSLPDNFDKKIIQAQNFNGKIGEFVFIHEANCKLPKVYVGSGDNNLHKALAHAALKLPANKYKLAENLAQSILLAWSLGQYKYDYYKENTTPTKQLVVEKKLLDMVLIDASTIYKIRDLINAPANILGPEELSQTLKSLAKEHGGKFKEWVGEELLKQNFPAVHAVGRASEKDPRLLSLTWGNTENPRITLIGKGVCFDSGGLDIKPSIYMRLMKKDMGGAAQVIGLCEWIMKQKLAIHLQVLIPAVENSVANNAYRPGDILTMRNGLRVEIDNTDAEGRLVLADAIAYATEQTPELIIDFATLTGAARVAVGTEISAMFTNNDDLAKALEKAAIEVEDPVWRLPLFAEYDNLLDSSIADCANCSAQGFAGAITAALFLQRFVKNIPWVHFDIMAWNISNKPGKPEGGEAMGMQAVARYLLLKYGKQDEIKTN